MRKSRRVVITGLGVVAPNGIGKDAFWDALVAGKSGIDYISAFDASDYPCRVAGEVTDFVATDFIQTRKARRERRMAISRVIVPQRGRPAILRFFVYL